MTDRRAHSDVRKCAAVFCVLADEGGCFRRQECAAGLCCEIGVRVRQAAIAGRCARKGGLLPGRDAAAFEQAAIMWRSITRDSALRGLLSIPRGAYPAYDRRAAYFHRGWECAARLCVFGMSYSALSAAVRRAIASTTFLRGVARFRRTKPVPSSPKNVPSFRPRRAF